MHRSSVQVPPSAVCYTVLRCNCGKRSLRGSVLTNWSVPAVMNTSLLAPRMFVFTQKANARINKFLIRIIDFLFFTTVVFKSELKKNISKNDTHHSEGLEENNHKGISSASGAPIEYVCFSHQSSLFSVLFNLFTFGPYWRGTVY